MTTDKIAGGREEIAIIGMAGRFPGARNTSEFWVNIRDGVESIRSFTPEELKASGLDPKILKSPRYVNRGGVLEDADLFDAEFFSISPKEAEFMDPQHRVFLECAWEALDNAGYDPDRYDGLIGMFGGVARNMYFIRHAEYFRSLIDSGALHEILLGFDKDFPATRVSYKMNLKGPSVNVQTACSTSGVAIHMACQSLLFGECDMAIAGGVRVQVPLMGGYLYAEGGILSPDGYCRAFDEKAKGTVFGSGAGMVVLKRVTDAVRDGDCIYAVIKGSAINNDGADKVGFTAPSVKGQAAVIEEALAVAGVDADSIDYIEAHGTATALGDPIEIAALTKAFRRTTARKNYCAIGSVKSNIGHLDAGACVVGVIKTVLALKQRLIPPSVHFDKPNPQIDFANSPFYVNTRLQEWKKEGSARRAGVSSFGLGGTNVHIILEEAPEPSPSMSGRSWQLLSLSAKTPKALEAATTDLIAHLRRRPDMSLADAAYTLQTGRKAFPRRRIAVCRDADDAVTAFETMDPKGVITSSPPPSSPDVVFMFPGQASQYPNMGLELYKTERAFRDQVDFCADFLKPILSLDIRESLYPSPEETGNASETLKQTSYAQPAIFITEYALARQWMTWGIIPKTMVGHSIGEYVAACLAGVFSLPDALSLVAARGQLIQSLPGGSMLAVTLSEKEIRPYLSDKISLAAVNGPSLCVCSGGKAFIEELEHQLSKNNVVNGRLQTSHAFHSRMMDPILGRFADVLKNIKLQPPKIPYVSNLTGTWIRPEEVIDPAYWVRHLRQTVRFDDCARELLKEPGRIFLEVGPGQTLSTLLRQHHQQTEKRTVLSSTRHPKEERSDVEFILQTLGRLWSAGVDVNWKGFYGDEERQRVPLPSYPFERKRFWIGSEQPAHSASQQLPASSKGIKPAPSPGGPAWEPQLLKYEGAPRNPVEQSLARIWEDVLGVKQVRIQDNFFELGGSSLMAARLNAQIEEIFGKPLPPSAIFQAPTIEQLSTMLDQKSDKISAAPRYSLALLRDGGPNPPFFCLPGALGNVFTDLGYLARHLITDRPFYGLQDGLEVPSKVNEMAAQYIREIRSVQPEGPYYIGGVCSGGTVAFEIAQQLQAQKQTVALLALIEPAPPIYTYGGMLSFIVDRFIHRVSHHSGEITHLGSAERRAYILLRVKLVSNLWFLKRYYPQSYPGFIHIFLTKGSLDSRRPLWGNLALNGAEIHEIPGTHNTITGLNGTPIEEAHMRGLAEKLSHYLQ